MAYFKKTRFHKLSLIKLTVVTAAVFLILSTFLWKLPGWVEEDLARRWSALCGGKVEVRIEAGAPWEILLGKVKALEVRGEGIRAGGKASGLRIASFRAYWEKFQFDLFALVFESRLKIVKPGRVQARVVLAEGDINDYLKNLKFGSVIDPSLVLGKNEVTIKARLKLGNMPPLVMRAKPYIAGPARLGFRPISLEVAGLKLPRVLRKALLSKAGFTVGWEGFPFPVALNKVEVERPNLILTGGAGP